MTTSEGTSAGTSEEEFDRYFDDYPVGLAGDLLWEGRIIRKEITSIAKSLIKPLLNPRLSVLPGSSTFAIYGRSGSGRSSALQMIQEEAETLAREKGVADRLKFCKYSPLVYANLPYDTRTTLALRMLTAVAGGPAQAIERFLPVALIKNKLEELLAEGNAIDQEAGIWYALENITISLASLIGFDEILRGALAETDGRNSVLVVLVDDLDHCKTDFIAKELETIQQLSNVPNLFFILAVEQGRLYKAIKELFEETEEATDPDFASEEYIQHSVSIPDIDRDSLKSFVERLIQEELGRGLFADAIAANIYLLQHGLRVLTPRSVKRCIDTIRSTLEDGLKSAATIEERQSLVKERLLEYTWRDFYNRHFRSAQAEAALPPERRPRLGAFNAFAHLEDACSEFAFSSEFPISRDEDLLRFRLKRLSDSYQRNWEALPLDLVAYLGLPPYWFSQMNSIIEDLSQSTTKKSMIGKDLSQSIMKKSEIDEEI